MYEEEKSSDSNSDRWIFLRMIFYDMKIIKKPIVGVEPTTFYLQGKCSTN